MEHFELDLLLTVNFTITKNSISFIIDGSFHLNIQCLSSVFN